MSQKPDVWMPLYIGDYLADTGHLSASEHGAYLLLIMHYWRTGELTDDDAVLRRIARMSPPEWKRSRETIAAFFQSVNGVWKHQRVDRELALCRANKEAQRRRTAAATAARYGQRNVHVTESPSPSPSPSKEDSEPTGSAQITTPGGVVVDPGGVVVDPGGVVVDLKAMIFGTAIEWLSGAVGKPTARLRPLVGRWCRDHGDPVVLDALIAAQRESPVDAVAWVTGRLLGAGKRRSAIEQGLEKWLFEQQEFPNGG